MINLGTFKYCLALVGSIEEPRPLVPSLWIVSHGGGGPGPELEECGWWRV